MTDFPPNQKDFTPFCKNMDALIDLLYGYIHLYQR